MDRRQFLALASGALTLPWPACALPPPPASRRLALVNAHTGERFDGPYRDTHGPITSALDELSYFLRDHQRGQRIEIDVRVLDFLAAVMEAVGAPRATVLSAYRTVETNQLLARTTFGVAENSEHLYGRALDVHFDARLEEAMRAARAMRLGGVGWYPNSGFIHLDSGPVRNWTLEGHGFERLLLQVQQLLAKGGLTISERGELLLGRARRPPSAAQRLALHRTIANATLLTGAH